VSVALLLLGLVWAQGTVEPDGGEPGAGEPSAEEPVYEVVVWGRHAVRQARAEVVRGMEELGYRAVRERGDAVVFRPPSPWMGRALLYRDGRLDFRTPMFAAKGVSAPPPAQLDHGVDLDRQATDGIAVGPEVHVFISRTKVHAVHRRTREALQPRLQAYQAVIRETAYREALDSLADRLDALWLQGVPLQGGGVLDTPQSRRAAVLDYWATRASTPEGHGTCDAIELWLRETVQTSEHPLTAAEIETANARRGGDRRLGVGPAPDPPR